MSIMQNMIINKYGEVRDGVWKWKAGTPQHIKEIWRGLLAEGKK